MHRLGARNVVAWIAGTATLVFLAATQLGTAFPWLWFAAGGLLAVAASRWIFDFAREERRSRVLKAFALANGWTFREDTSEYRRRFHGYPFGIGAQEDQVDLLSGPYQSRPCATFTLRADLKKNDDSWNRVTQEFQVTLAELDVNLPRLDLIPESMASRVVAAVGGSDVNLESAAFNRAWRVLCSDRRYATDVLDPRMMERLLQSDARGLAIRIDGSAVLAWDAATLTTRELRRRLDVVCGVAAAIPSHVVRTYTEAQQQRRAIDDERERNAPTWAKTGGVLNSGHYTGIGVDSDGDGVDDYTERSR